MATSITASTVSPYSNYLLQDTNYNIVGSFPLANATASTPSVYFPNVGEPEVGHFVIQLYNTAVTNTSSSLSTTMSLQHSSDNVNFTLIPQINPILLSFTDAGSSGVTGGSGSAGNVQVTLPPNVKPYIRAWVNVPSGASTSGGLTGSYGFVTLF